MSSPVQPDSRTSDRAAAGFTDIRLKPKDESRSFIRDWAPGSKIEDYVVSATIEAVKPRG